MDKEDFIALNFSEGNDPFPQGLIDVTEKLSTPCVRPTKKAEDLKFGYETFASLEAELKKKYNVQLQAFLAGKHNDRRKDVNTAENPERHKQFPFSAICALDIFTDNGQYFSGTGFMIGPMYVLTAAHNVRLETYGYAQKIFVSPGRSKSSNPFNTYKATHAILFSEVFKGKSYDDMALLAIDYDIGEYTGWFGLLDMNYSELKGLDQEFSDDGFRIGGIDLHVTGYDPPKFIEEKGIQKIILQTMKTHSGDLMEMSKFESQYKRDDVLSYDIDTFTGQSGSPLWILSGQNFYAVGVHNSSAKIKIESTASTITANMAARLTREKISKICELINQSKKGKVDSFANKAPQDLSEVVKALEAYQNDQEKKNLISNLSKYQSHKIVDPYKINNLAQNNKLFDSNVKSNSEFLEVKENPKDKFQVICKVFARNKNDSKNFEMDQENYSKIIEATLLEDNDSISYEFKGNIDQSQFESILKMVQQIPKLYHLDIKIDISNVLNVGEILSKMPTTIYFDLHVKENYDEKAMDRCKSVIDSILAKDSKMNFYLEFEFDNFNAEEFSSTKMKISNNEYYTLTLHCLDKGFCILGNDPRHLITKENIGFIKARKDIIKCVKTLATKSEYEEKNFALNLHEILQDKKFIEFGKKSKSYLEKAENELKVNPGINLLVDQDDRSNLYEISMALKGDAFLNFDHIKFKANLKKISSIRLDFQKAEADDKTLLRLCDIIKGSACLKNLDINLNYSDRITITGLMELSHTIQILKSSLESLSLSFHRVLSISDFGLKGMLQPLQKLSKLSCLTLHFSKCKSITDEGIRDFAELSNSASNMRELNLNFFSCESITDTGIKCLSQSIQKISKISNLTLNFRSCPLITDNGLTSLSGAIKGFSELYNLDLDFGSCKLITNVGFIDLAQSIQLIPNLMRLNLDFSECESITGKGFRSLSQSLNELSALSTLSLHFKYLESLLDGDIIELSKRITNKFSLCNLTLDFSYCACVTDSVMIELSQVVKKLSRISNLTLHFRNCESITDDGIKDLLEYLSNSEMLTLDLDFSNSSISKKTEEKIKKIFKNF